MFVGDEAFPLRRDLMRPYPGTLTPGPERTFNYRLSRARLVVECSFGILASQWRMYRRVMGVSPNTAEVCVKATCILHNYLRVMTMRGGQRSTSAAAGDADGLQAVDRLGARNATREAMRIRQQLTSYFSEEGAVPWQAQP